MKKPLGPKVVGAAKAAEMAAAVKTTQRLGPKVLGKSRPTPPKVYVRPQEPPPPPPPQDEDEGQDEEQETPAGPPGPKPPLTIEELVAKYATDDGYLSIENIRRVLAELPAGIDRLLAWEMARASKPRIGALRAIREAELARKGGGRMNVLTAIDTTLASLKPQR